LAQNAIRKLINNMCGTTCKKFGDEVVATKHDISKFMGYHGFIIIFNESNTSAKDTLPKSLKLYIEANTQRNICSSLYIVGYS